MVGNKGGKKNKRGAAKEKTGPPLPCARNETIMVDRALATRLGVHIYEQDKTPCAMAKISLKLQPKCPECAAAMKHSDKHRQMLVTGVQRSGTHYAWEMFNRLGVHVHHEGLGPHGAVSWFFAYKSNSYAINNPDSLSVHHFCFVFHQVRHPMRVISSVVKASKKPWDTYWAWIAKMEPRICEGAGGKKCQKLPLLLRASRLWLYWNEHIETYADIRFKVEETSPRDVCRLAQFEERLCGSDGRYHTTSSKVIQPIVEPAAPADGHTGVEHLQATWEAIEALDPALAEKMKEMTRRYGYHLDPAMHPQSLDTSAFRAGGKDEPKAKAKAGSGGGSKKFAGGAASGGVTGGGARGAGTRKGGW